MLAASTQTALGELTALLGPQLVGRVLTAPPQNLTLAFSPLSFEPSALQASQLTAPNLLLNQGPSLSTINIYRHRWCRRRCIRACTRSRNYPRRCSTSPTDDIHKPMHIRLYLTHTHTHTHTHTQYTTGRLTTP